MTRKRFMVKQFETKEDAQEFIEKSEMSNFCYPWFDELSDCWCIMDEDGETLYAEWQ